MAEIAVARVLVKRFASAGRIQPFLGLEQRQAVSRTFLNPAAAGESRGAFSPGDRSVLLYRPARLLASRAERRLRIDRRSLFNLFRAYRDLAEGNR